VFAAGTMDFGGTALEPPVSQLLENLWQHMLADATSLPTPES
jgi:hypothetical protein